MAWPSSIQVPDVSFVFKSVKVVFGPNASATGGNGSAAATPPKTTHQLFPSGN